MKNALNFKNWDKDHSKHAFLKNAYNTAKFQAYFWMTASAISVFLKAKIKRIQMIFSIWDYSSTPFLNLNTIATCHKSTTYVSCHEEVSEWWLTLLKTLPYWLALFVTRYASRYSLQKIANYEQKRAFLWWNTQCLIGIAKLVKKAK